ncbi:GNAT family N-acetyltransferase [Nocardia panacis]|uniref:GNAT family N-acetyltransferase n=2 Tax=Nocardia panacis TaxID=2340916 RepID=A0A3A4KSJ2_9NOCA|nr:GNAT family N-acetyltransferase [Nocardia panacis]
MVGFVDPPGLDNAAQYEPPTGVFLVAYTNTGDAIACGGLRAYLSCDSIAEIRKMYVAPAHRGRGLGHRILAELEQHASAHGVREVRLETGSYNRPALHLYPSAGYRPIPPYVPGRPSFNRAFAKKLSSSA